MIYQDQHILFLTAIDNTSFAKGNITCVILRRERRLKNETTKKSARAIFICNNKFDFSKERNMGGTYFCSVVIHLPLFALIVYLFS